MWLPATWQHAVRHRSNASTDDADDTAPWRPQDGIAWLTVVGRAPADVRRPLLLEALETRHQEILKTRSAGIDDQARRDRVLRDRVSLIDGTHGLSSLRQSLAPALQVLMGMSLLVLVVAAANLANFLLARGAVGGASSPCDWPSARVGAA
jgi:hypothetical protein